MLITRDSRGQAKLMAHTSRSRGNFDSLAKNLFEPYSFFVVAFYNKLNANKEFKNYVIHFSLNQSCF